MCQRAWIELDRLDHQVKLHIVSSSQKMSEVVNDYGPDLIVAPFLKTIISKEIWQNFTCLIVHPGIPGDRGSASLDWAILNNEKAWGVTILEAAEKMDSGKVWAHSGFEIRPVSKSQLYRHEVTEAAMHALLEAVKKFEEKNFLPQVVEEIKLLNKGKWNRAATQDDFSFSWADKTAVILRKINAADSSPGALQEILGKKYYCYGAVEEAILKGEAGEIIARRNEAICIATSDGAVWLQCLKEPGEEKVKLPATRIIKEELLNFPENLINIFEDDLSIKTFREISYHEEHEVGYLYFDFYNGAMSTRQCKLLHEALKKVKQRNTKVLVLLGGSDVWSNGIHLNIIEASENPAQESWENINALDDLIEEIIKTESHYIISAIRGNAGAGGVALAIAADKVIAQQGIIFNPHTRNMGLYGSEYWTYLLPKRIGTERAQMFTEQCLPWGTAIALEVKLIDECFAEIQEEFINKVKKSAGALASLGWFPKLLEAKKFKRNREESYKPLHKYREEELEKMQKNFFDDDMGYDYKRYCFVHGKTADEALSGIASKDLYNERRKIWRRRKYEKLFYEA